MTIQSGYRQTERGAVLVVSLIVLLVVTLLGVAGMNSSLLQERMAANAQNSNRAFQGAESAVGVLTNTLIGGDLSALSEAMSAADSTSSSSSYSIGGGDQESSFEAEFLGEIIISSGSSMDANESTTLLKGYRFELRGTSAIPATGASATVNKGIEYY